MQIWSLSRSVMLCCTLLLSSWSALAADLTTPAGRLDADKACTTCHDENWKYPVLRIYQTPHGVRGDSRA
ncbi:MAG: hypothetical protein P4L70_02095, partial [Parasulfuritortus sp.]|nr:hypothetical protein [Parasulfuritortus sp.]